jgi:hypothetical protein
MYPVSSVRVFYYKGNPNSLGKQFSLKIYEKSKVNIYARRGIVYNTCLARLSDIGVVDLWMDKMSTLGNNVGGGEDSWGMYICTGRDERKERIRVA